MRSICDPFHKADETINGNFATGSHSATGRLARRDHSALDRLMSLVYDELHALAGRFMRRERGDHTLQTTTLVNEAYLKLVGRQSADWQNRAHFFGVVAQVMRHLLIDHARSGDMPVAAAAPCASRLMKPLPLHPANRSICWALNEVLDRLDEIDERKRRIVELRYFSGLSVEETAEVLGLSAITIKREWLKAKAWLYRELNREGTTAVAPEAANDQI